MTQTLSPLERVASARIWKEECATEWRNAIRDARGAGHSAEEVAQAAGVSRQAIYKLLGVKGENEV